MTAHTTTFNGRRRRTPGAIDRVGLRFGTVEIVRNGYHGNVFGKCDLCGEEKLFTKEQLRRGTVKCGCSK